MVLKKGVLENRGTGNELIKVIDNCVWECLINPKDLDYYLSNFIISNQKHQEGNLVLRIISKEKPSSNSRIVSPKLEDLYLYYFRKEEMK